MFPGQYQYSGGESPAPAPSPGIRFRGLLQAHEATTSPPRGMMMLSGSGGSGSVNGNSSISNSFTLIPGVYDITLRQQPVLMPPPPPPPTPVYQQQQVQITRQAGWRLQSSRQSQMSNSSSQSSGCSSPLFYPRGSPSLDQTRRPSLGGNLTPVQSGAVQVAAMSPGRNAINIQMGFGGGSVRPGPFQAGSPRELDIGPNSQPCPGTPRNLSQNSDISFGSTGSFDLSPDLHRSEILAGSPRSHVNFGGNSQERNYGTGLGNNSSGSSSQPIGQNHPTPYPTLGNCSGRLASSQAGFGNGYDMEPRSFEESSAFSFGTMSQMSPSLLSSPPPSPYDDDDDRDMIEATPSSQLAAYTQQWY